LVLDNPRPASGAWALLSNLNQIGTHSVMRAHEHVGHAAPQTVGRTVRFPSQLRARIAADAERCGRSFEAQVLAILRRHYGEDVDIAPSPDTILALARGSLAGMSAADKRLVTRKLVSDDER
jgi:hypothetical protein